MSELVWINGRPWKQDRDISPHSRRMADRVCGSGLCQRCGAPNYAHHLNVIEHPTNCIRYEPKEQNQ